MEKGNIDSGKMRYVRIKAIFKVLKWHFEINIGGSNVLTEALDALEDAFDAVNDVMLDDLEV